MSNSDRHFEIEGHTLGFPSICGDASASLGFFLVSSRAANALIRDSGFEVAQVAPGWAVFSLTCVDYRESDCGEYREISMAFFVKKTGRSFGIPYVGTWLDIIRNKAATYVWKLPVTSQLACDAGVQMWGLPKTVEDIDMDFSGDYVTFNLHIDGQRVLSYTVRAVGKRSRPHKVSTLYSVYEGSPHVTRFVHKYGSMGTQLRGGALSLGTHPIAEQLRGLGLPRRSLISSWIGRLSLEVVAPEKL